MYIFFIQQMKIFRVGDKPSEEIFNIFLIFDKINDCINQNYFYQLQIYKKRN